MNNNFELEYTREKDLIYYHLTGTNIVVIDIDSCPDQSIIQQLDKLCPTKTSSYKRQMPHYYFTVNDFPEIMRGVQTITYCNYNQIDILQQTSRESKPLEFKIKPPTITWI